MKDEPPANIFDFASSKGPKPKKHTPKEPLAKKEQPSETIKKKPPQSSPPSADKKNYTDSETVEMLEKMNTMRRDLEKKLEGLYQQSGMSGDELQAYLDNPKNVGEVLWEKIQQQRQELSDKLYKMVGIEEKARSTIKKSKEKEEAVKKRKGKTLGTRKKWIPIR